MDRSNPRSEGVQKQSTAKVFANTPPNVQDSSHTLRAARMATCGRGRRWQISAHTQEALFHVILLSHFFICFSCLLCPRLASSLVSPSMCSSTGVFSGRRNPSGKAPHGWSAALQSRKYEACPLGKQVNQTTNRNRIKDMTVWNPHFTMPLGPFLTRRWQILKLVVHNHMDRRML